MILASNPLSCFRPLKEMIDMLPPSYDGIEILAEKEHGWENRDKVLDTISNSDLKFQIHAPFNDINPASMNENMRKASIREIVKSIKMADLLDIDVVTMHPGILSPTGRYWDHVHNACIESLKEIQIHAEDMDVTLALENMPYLDMTMGRTPDEMRKILDSTGLKFCLDLGHAHTSEKIMGFLEIEPVNIHIHDNYGGKDLHLPLGEGNAVFEPVITDGLKDYKGNWVIEGRDWNGLVRSKKYLQDLLDKV